MLILAGLGNPGRQYHLNRHNVGFMALDAIREHHGLDPWHHQFQADCVEGILAGKKCALLKPRTFMNLSGQSVSEAMRFYKIEPTSLLVFHDAIDLEAGCVRLKAGGGCAGHNGLRSISAHIGNSYCRIRIGIGHPGDKALVRNHVLGNFSESEWIWLKLLLDHLAKNTLDFVHFLSSQSFPESKILCTAENWKI